MTYITIRRNSAKKIDAILNSAALITRYRYCDMDQNTNSKSSAEVVREKLAAGDISGINAEVTESGEIICATFTIHQNHFYNVYMTKEAAKASLIPAAYARYFGQEDAKPAKPRYRYNWNKQRIEVAA